MSPLEILAVVLIVFLCLALMANVYVWSELRFDRSTRLAMHDDLEAERRLLSEEIGKLAAQSHEIGLNWKALSDKVQELSITVQAVKANQVNNNTSVGGGVRR